MKVRIGFGLGTQVATDDPAEFAALVGDPGPGAISPVTTIFASSALSSDWFTWAVQSTGSSVAPSGVTKRIVP